METDGQAPKVPILGLSDALNWPTGFGRVARELITRIPQDLYRVGFLSQWVGSGRFPGITCYGHPTSKFAADGFPQAVMDFAGRAERFVLWTLLDPWMTGWISHPRHDPNGTWATRKFFQDGHRGRFVWVGHFPIDGKGPREGPARWTERYLEAMDIPVAMSEWGRGLVQPLLPGKEVRMVPHAVNDGFAPSDRAAARAEAENGFFRMTLVGRMAAREVPPGERIPPDVVADARRRTFRMGDGFTVVCVMANRARKYWPDALRAFAALAEDLPDARFVGVCGDRRGIGGEDMWPLEDLCRELGLRLDEEAEDPNVCLIEHVMDRPDAPPESSMRMLYAAADCALLLSGGEGFGLPQLEAHACGIPCVVGDYSASTEIAVNRRELVQPRGFTETPNNMVRRPIYDPGDVASRLKWVAKNPEWRREAGAAGLEQAARHRWDRILPMWLEVFAEAARLVGQTPEEAPDARPAEPAGTPG